MSDTFIAEVLSSEERWKILELLVTDSLSDEQISRALGISIRSVRRHIASLVGARLVDVSNGGPRLKEKPTYRTTALAKTVGFPPRKYEQLSEALISGLVASLGERSAKLVLRDIALKTGQDIGRSLLENASLDSLTMDQYARFVVNGLLTAQKAYPRLVRHGRTSLVYQQFNCPYQELAEKMPALVCDVLDKGVQEGLGRALGVRTTRLSCRGHGDSSCRFRVVRRT